MYSPFLDLTQMIRFISCTCANLAGCLCSWGLLLSPAAHHAPLLTDVNNSLHCLHPEVKVSFGSLRGRASYVQKSKWLIDLGKVWLFLFKADQSFLSECIILFIGYLIIRKFLFLY